MCKTISITFSLSDFAGVRNFFYDNHKLNRESYHTNKCRNCDQNNTGLKSSNFQSLLWILLHSDCKLTHTLYLKVAHYYFDKHRDNKKEIVNVRSCPEKFVCKQVNSNCVRILKNSTYFKYCG
jgi:hypothetical protein